MMQAAEILAAKIAIEQQLLSIPGVHSVGVGPKLTNGKRMGELSIIVWVSRKLPIAAVPADQLIPPQIRGVKTDVVERPVPVVGRSGDSTHPTTEDGSTFDPLVGGCRIQRKFEDMSGTESIESGTLGCLVTTQGGLPGIPKGMVAGLTCHHVLYGCSADANIGGKVGQPTPADSCSKCCNDIIGTALVGKSVIDCALIALQPTLNYQAEVWNIGPIVGTHEVLASEIPVTGPDVYAIQKRGFRTGLTSGQIVSVNHSGSINDSNGNVCHNYTNALAMLAIDAANTPFAKPGDSGSAIICNQGADKGKVVGVYFGGTPLYSLASHIQDVMTALSIDVVTATTAGVTLQVPKVAGDPVFTKNAAIPEGSLMQFADPDEMQALAKAQTEVAATIDGNDFLKSLQSHQHELRSLIDKNRRISTVWRRNGGPLLLQSLLRVAKFHDQAFPAEINGQSLQECVTKIQRVLLRYSSPELSCDVSRLGSRLARFAGLTYSQILTSLQASPGS